MVVEEEAAAGSVASLGHNTDQLAHHFLSLHHQSSKTRITLLNSLQLSFKNVYSYKN
jgi:hypothetical protein